MITELDKIYANGAYRSNSKKPLPPPRSTEDANRTGMFNTHLAFGNYANLEPEVEVSSQLETIRLLVRDKKSDHDEETYCSNKRWKFQNSSKVAHSFFVLKLVCYSFIWAPWVLGVFGSIGAELGYGNPGTAGGAFIGISTAILMLTSLVLFMKGNKFAHYMQILGFVAGAMTTYWMQGSLFSANSMCIALWAGAFLYFVASLGTDALLWTHSKISTHDGSEFNRTDGMLRFKRRFRQLFVAPFEEFDPVLQLLPNGFGSHDYALWLHHRYTDNKICLATKVHSLGLDQSNALAFWDCLQRYMDVTQPLPDLPALEQSRHLDPVTAAHDVKTGRNPRRWRDQSEKGWATGGLKTLSKQLQEYPWQKEACIVKARIDPSLTIEAYYRAQEAKGIVATPKADDFDDVHRPG
jgi:hypothetical protein